MSSYLVCVAVTSTARFRKVGGFSYRTRWLASSRTYAGTFLSVRSSWMFTTEMSTRLRAWPFRAPAHVGGVAQLGVRHVAAERGEVALELIRHDRERVGDHGCEAIAISLVAWSCAGSGGGLDELSELLLRDGLDRRELVVELDVPRVAAVRAIPTTT